MRVGAYTCSVEGWGVEILRFWRRGALLTAAIALMGAGQAHAAMSPTEQLGKLLFFDKTLSHAGTQSCASCHDPGAAFSDPDKTHATSKGDNTSLFGPRNAPSAMYMAYSPDFYFDTGEGLYIGGQFDDGRAATLELQAQGPFVNSVEMGNATRAEVISRLQSGPNASAFQAVYGAAAFADVDTAYVNISNAIAAFERTEELSPFTSKFDYFTKGQTSLSAAEARGLDVFNDPGKGNCAACHLSTSADGATPPLFTDFTYDNIGIPKNFHSDFLGLPPGFNPDGAGFLDKGLGGRADIDDQSLWGAFKVTTLRNIALTAPYGHNGYFTSLEQIVDFYATRDTKGACANPDTTAADAELQGCWPTPEFGDQMNVDELGNLPLTDQDKADLVAFLNTLTDGYQISAVPEPAEWALLIAGIVMVGAFARRRRALSA
jgi:cytochrome c peroxidase